MGFLPDEAKVLPPPDLMNSTSFHAGLMGWVTAMTQNALEFKPPLRSGLHRQLLYVSIGWFIGYHLQKHANYKYAKLDRDVREYIRAHPDAFPVKERRKFSEIMEPFHPIR